MRAVILDEQVRVASDAPLPDARKGWAIIRVLQAGICSTDLELIKGYMNYRGTLGHEFVGQIESCNDETRIGQRVVGEINASCGACETCHSGMERHCPNRSVLGILNLNGCMADYCSLPLRNLHHVPDGINDRCAVFTEPLAAAYEILEQVTLDGSERCVVLGDGKLGILCAWVLSTILDDVTLIGHHETKLAAAKWNKLQTLLTGQDSGAPADLVVEATGSASGLEAAMEHCRPQGKLVLKSTVARNHEIDLSPIVIHELDVIGSRCGPFDRALHGLSSERYPVERLVSAEFTLDRAEEALARAAQRDSLKVILNMV